MRSNCASMAGSKHSAQYASLLRPTPTGASSRDAAIMLLSLVFSIHFTMPDYRRYGWKTGSDTIILKYRV